MYIYNNNSHNNSFDKWQVWAPVTKLLSQESNKIFHQTQMFLQWKSRTFRVVISKIQNIIKKKLFSVFQKLENWSIHYSHCCLRFSLQLAKVLGTRGLASILFWLWSDCSDLQQINVKSSSTNNSNLMKTLVQLRSNMNFTALDQNFSHLINVAQASSNQSHMVGFQIVRYKRPFSFSSFKLKTRIIR